MTDVVSTADVVASTWPRRHAADMRNGAGRSLAARNSHRGRCVSPSSHVILSPLRHADHDVADLPACRLCFSAATALFLPPLFSQVVRSKCIISNIALNKCRRPLRCTPVRLVCRHGRYRRAMMDSRCILLGTSMNDDAHGMLHDGRMPMPHAVALSDGACSITVAAPFIVLSQQIAAQVFAYQPVNRLLMVESAIWRCFRQLRGHWPRRSMRYHLGSISFNLPIALMSG